MDVGGLAANIASGLGFQKGDDIVQILKDGSIFTDTLQEHWRHQLLRFNIVSFWGSRDNVSMLDHYSQLYTTDFHPASGPKVHFQLLSRTSIYYFPPIIFVIWCMCISYGADEPPVDINMNLGRF